MKSSVLALFSVTGVYVSYVMFMRTSMTDKFLSRKTPLLLLVSMMYERERETERVYFLWPPSVGQEKCTCRSTSVKRS